MIIQRLKQQGVIHPPEWFDETSCHYVTIMGSEAYAVSSGSSDVDLYAFAVPPRDLVFPERYGDQITGFGNQVNPFSTWQQHHIKSLDNQKDYDVSIYSIVSYFQLVMEANPNMTDSLFTPQRCVMHMSHLAEHVIRNRRAFLSKQAWHKYRGYAFSQLKKIRSGTNASNEQRAADIEAYGYSLKFAYHVPRLLSEVEQILIEHDLDLERNSELLKSIRRGEWTLERLEAWTEKKLMALEDTFAKSDLRIKPDEKVLKELLMQCLEQHYGKIERVQKEQSLLLDDLKLLLEKYS